MYNILRTLHISGFRSSNVHWKFTDFSPKRPTDLCSFSEFQRSDLAENLPLESTWTVLRMSWTFNVDFFSCCWAEITWCKPICDKAKWPWPLANTNHRRQFFSTALPTPASMDISRQWAKTTPCKKGRWYFPASGWPTLKIYHSRSEYQCQTPSLTSTCVGAPKAPIT